ncbi:aspartyl-tRNA(Asn)/glutamyl-tRNA (Gln) amidotransferase subunit B [Legionella lansingensis]|uniref:Aspartyl/glutamyl-tRNA(Asn/Gln) amidotransferase subunit B n=1 Tax=Legionella lansingensis TaxID=45067 RepID=A0A0W0VGS8_9GAMM|nr:Asp-tRNA(Asn)/Glu-tRNA(Gln) amidotransferase subunit GatB [Legionella lansingensis]KTD19313.1 aspartyl/glutamyl-tRNA amidotransferase subunit B [Legionella lansingensis]SNV50427.1 aspartyl-tRNA(Asn)/glutamyl-tRNA (Gln) amidotransferase subunit B [Legionella lansingensis]
MAWDTVIGLEVHAQLKTNSKLFSATATKFGAQPNSQTSFIDAGLPGVLPVLNKEAVSMAILFGLAINAEINNNSYFERKNYFYPDLPKGYQISQFQAPIVSHGYLAIELSDGTEKKVTIVRAHLEEDAGKSLHEAHPTYSGIDLNRAGTPLLEIVTAPCLFSAEEAIAYLKHLHQLVRFLGICDGNMQEGSFRCDVNLSLKPKGSNKLGVRTELKNLNSFRFIEKAILYEQARHQDLLESGQIIQQETRLYSPDTNTTQPLRTKENENDYRYFPDPDLLPIQIKEEDLDQLKKAMPPLPEQIKRELNSNPAFNNEDINFLLSSPATYHFFCAVRKQSHANEKTIVNWLKGTYAAALNEKNLSFENPPILATTLAKLLDHVTNQTLSTKIAKELFGKLWEGETDIEKLIKQEGYEQLSDNKTLEELVRKMIDTYPQQVVDYRAGKEKLFAFFVGQIMKETKGRASPEEINRLLKQFLNQ